MVIFVIVVRGVRLSAADGGERRIHDGVKRRGTLLDGSGVDVGLEGTADLAVGLRGAIEFGIFKTVAADHGFDFADRVVNGDHGGLRGGLLFELYARGGFTQFLNGDLMRSPAASISLGFLWPVQAMSEGDKRAR